MTVEISTYIDVKKRVADLGLKQPDSLVILPRNFDAATSKDELLHENQSGIKRLPVIRVRWCRKFVDYTSPLPLQTRSATRIFLVRSMCA